MSLLLGRVGPEKIKETNKQMRLNTFCSFTYKVNKLNYILNYVGLVCVFLSRMVIFKATVN